MTRNVYDSSSGQVAALRRWAREPDPAASTAPARRAFLRRFEDEIDPDRTMPAAERETRARRLMRAHMIELASRSRTKRAQP